MIDRIDHVVLGVADLAAAEAAYAILLGRGPSWRTPASGGGADVTIFGLSNIALEIMAPAKGDGPGESSTGARLRAAIERDGEGLKSLVLHSPDLSSLAKRWDQVGLAPEPIAEGASIDALSGRERRWTRTRAGATPGVRVFAVSSTTALPQADVMGDSPVLGVDHLVIRTPAPERALAFYGAKLGLDLRMDRTFEAFGGARMMFFRVGDAILEVVHDPQHASDGPDQLWGVTWRVADADAARTRLLAAGLDVSDVRTGRKPGTRVFTVRNGTCSVPTLMLEQAAKRSTTD